MEKNSAYEMLRLVFVLLGVDLLYSLAIWKLLNSLEGRLFENTGINTHDDKLSDISFPLKIIPAVIIEEWIFRYIIFSVILIGGFHLSPTSAIIWSSVIFGVVHGGFLNIFMQGAGGVVLCIIFLKGEPFLCDGRTLFIQCDYLGRL